MIGDIELKTIDVNKNIKIFTLRMPNSDILISMLEISKMLRVGGIQAFHVGKHSP